MRFIHVCVKEGEIVSQGIEDMVRVSTIIAAELDPIYGNVHLILKSPDDA